MTFYNWRPWPFEGRGQTYVAVEWNWSGIAAVQYEHGGWWLEIDEFIREPVVMSLNVVTMDDAFTQADQVVDFWVTAERVIEEIESSRYDGG